MEGIDKMASIRENINFSETARNKFVEGVRLLDEERPGLQAGTSMSFFKIIIFLWTLEV